MDSLYYPRVLRRVQASFIDGAYIALWFYFLAFLPPMGEWSFLKPLFLVVAVLFNEPVLVTLTGGSIGHHVMRIRVTKSSGNGHINIFAATLRFIVKSLLGWFSLVVVMLTARHQALHDLAAHSVVVYKSVDALPAKEKLTDRPSLTTEYVMPSGWRRLGIGLAYFVLWYVVYTVLLTIFLTASCLYEKQCSELETALAMASSYLWVGATCAIIILAWRGQMYGARRTVRTSTRVN